MEGCPKSVIGSIAFWCPSVVSAWDLACCPRGVVPGWAAGHLVDSKFSVSPPLLSTGHMAINADLLAPGSSVFLSERHHRGMCACHCCGPLVLPRVCRHQSSDDSGDEIGISCSDDPCEDDA